MFDEELGPATAHPAAPVPASSSSEQVTRSGAPARSTGGAPAWSSTELTALVDQLACVDLDAPDAERVDQLTALERIKAACAAAQVRITDRFIDSQADLARQWHEQAQACSSVSDFDGWCAAREQARRHEFIPPTGNQPTDTADGQSPGGEGADGDGSEGAGRGSRGTRRAANPNTGVAAQVALARRESPAKGTRLVSHALALTRHLPHTLDALATGLLNEYRAGLVARLTSHLSPELQAAVDAQVIGANGQQVGTWGDRELERHVRACADGLDAAGAAERARVAESERRVTIRPVPDTMALLTAVLPVAQAVAVHAALARAAATAKAGGDPRTKNQIMADTLVALVTGQETASDVPIEIQVIITDRALFDGDDTPAHIPGYGPVPAAWVRHLLTPDPEDTDDTEDIDLDSEPDEHVGQPRRGAADSDVDLLNLDPEPDEQDAPSPPETRDSDVDLLDPDHPAEGHRDPPSGSASSRPAPSPQRPPPSFTPPVPSLACTPPVPPAREFRRAQTWLRRLFTHPATGTLVAMDSHRRVFDGGLRRFLITRDGTCRTPWCDAPVRHLDHIRRWTDGGPTTAANGEGLCVRCNLTQEQPGFSIRLVHRGPMANDGPDCGTPHEDSGVPHTVELTTPTGHTYVSSAPSVLPGPERPDTPRRNGTSTDATRAPQVPGVPAPTDLSPLEQQFQRLLAS